MVTLVALSWLLVGPAQPIHASGEARQETAVGDQAVDIRGIWLDTKLDVKKARARRLDPSVIETPVKMRDVRPSYPAVAQLARQQGTVHLECRIDVDATVQACRVSRKVAMSLDADADAEALACVAQWKYQPLKVSGEPKPALVELTVEFSIN